MSPSNSSAYSSSGRRWRPTPQLQQLMVLHELYRRGLTNPSASEIQRITAHLSCYGWIQGKNVFYWFQNHKARERQKLRKKQQQLSKQLHQPQLYHYHHHHHHHLHQQQQLINTTSTSHSDDFRRHQLFNCYSSPHHQDLFPQQGTAEGMILNHQTVDDDLSTDCLIRIDGRRDLVCCRNNRPLETLELFPLRPPTV